MVATKRTKKYEFVADSLWGKFPNSWVLMLEKSTKIALEAAMTLASFCALYATLLGPPHRSEWLYLLTASLGPVVVATWYIGFPFNPYRTTTATNEGMKNLDHSDKDAKEFVGLLKSPEAHLFRIEPLNWALKSWKEGERGNQAI